MGEQKLPKLYVRESYDNDGNLVKEFSNGVIVTLDQDGNVISRKDNRKQANKPANYRTPEDRMREIETRMAGIELRLERLENDGR